MLRIFERLRRCERFWPWLYGIAFNKVRNHYGKRWRQRTRCFSEVGYEPRVAGGGDALAEAVTAELKQVVLQCIGELRFDYIQDIDGIEDSFAAPRGAFPRAPSATSPACSG